jgi:hypothetical protein
MCWFLAPIVCLAFSQPSRPESETATRIEAVAAKLTVFQPEDFSLDREVHARFLPQKWRENQRATYAAITSSKNEEKELLALLKHRDANVRTLALAAVFHRLDPMLLPHIAGLKSDAAKTAPDFRIDSAVVSLPVRDDADPDPQDLHAQTVGQIAEVFVRFWLAPAGYTSEEFNQYWARHKDRLFCACWFEAKYRRVSQQISPFRAERADQMRALRREIDRLPELDRDWTLLWVMAQHSHVDQRGASKYLATEEDVVAVCKRLGPERMLALLHDRRISDDPDLAADEKARPRRDMLTIFVLQHAKLCFRESDAETVLDAAGSLLSRSLWNDIAASELRPSKAGEWLRAAMKRYPHDREKESSDRAELAAALWRISGEQEMDYLSDWFYHEIIAENPHTTSLEIFLDRLQGARAAGERKLAARLIAHERLDKLDVQSLRGLILFVNRWLKQPVVAPEELYRGQPVGVGYPDWRKKLRASIPTWSN